MKNYVDLLENILAIGEKTEGRNGVVYSKFGKTIEFDLQHGFPLVTIRKVHYPAVVHELLGFLNNDDAYIRENTKIWDPWEGKIPYGKWLQYAGSVLLDSINNDPNSRRHVLNGWENQWVKGNMDGYALPCCHHGIQVNIRRGDFLDLIWMQRSVDVPVGLPFNIASYATLLHLLALHSGKKPGRLIGQFGDVHIYENQIEGVRKMLLNKPFSPPNLVINKKPSFSKYTVNDFILEDYQAHPYFKIEVTA